LSQIAQTFFAKRRWLSPLAKRGAALGATRREVRMLTAVNRKILDIGGVERSSTNLEVK
jgi:hypothetical protein